MRKLIAPPRLWPADPHNERRATWMELFFDLIFVAAVAQVGKPLVSDYSAAGLLRYSFLFVLIWLAWTGHTLFTTRFDSDDLVQRIFILLQSFVAAVMAANSKEALDSVDAAGFGAAYAGMRVILVMQYLRARRVRETRELTTRYAAGFGAAAAVWVVSALVPVPWRYWLWGMALTIDLATPWLAAGHGAKFPPDATHYPERFGLFTIILLGEFVASVMHGIESQPYWSVPAATTAVTSMAFAFAVWWWYFDGARSAEARHARTRRERALFHAWNYAHLPLFLGIGVAGVGFEHMISLKEGQHLHHAEVWMLCGAVGLLMAALIAIGATSERGWRRGPPLTRLVSQTAVLAAVGLLAATVDVMNQVGLSLGLFAACVGQGALSRREAGSPAAERQIAADAGTR